MVVKVTQYVHLYLTQFKQQVPFQAARYPAPISRPTPVGHTLSDNHDCRLIRVDLGTSSTLQLVALTSQSPADKVALVQCSGLERDIVIEIPVLKNVYS